MLRHSDVAIAVLSLSALRVGAQAPSPRPNPPGVTTRFTVDSAQVTDLSVSPDGKWISYARFDSDDGTMASIWMASASNPKPFRITASGYSDRWPEMSPTGDGLFFVSNRPNRAPHSTEVYVMAVAIDRASGRPTGPVRQVTTDSVAITGNISPDGKWMAYEPRQGNPVRLVSTSGGNARTLATRQIVTPGYTTFTADGKYVVFGDSGGALRKAPVAGGPVVTLVPAASTTRYALPYPGHDDRYIYAPKPEGDTLALEVRDLSGHVYARMYLPKFYDSGPAGAHIRNDGLGLVGARPVWYPTNFAIKRITFSTGAVSDVQPAAEGFLVGEAPDGSIIRDHTVNGREQLVTVSAVGKRTALTLGLEINDVEYLLPGGARILAFGKDTTQCPKGDGAAFPTSAVPAYAVDPATGASHKIADAISGPALCLGTEFGSYQHAAEFPEVHGSNVTIETIGGDGTAHAAGSIPLATYKRVGDVAARGTRLAYADSSGKDATRIYVATNSATAPVPIADLPSGDVRLNWSPNGSKLVAAYPDKGNNERGTVRVFDVAADGTHTEPTAPLDLGAAIAFAFHTAWLPDASAVLVQLQDLGDHNTRVVLRPVDPARPPVRLSADLTHLSSLTFGPGGKSALYSVLYTARGSSIWTADFVPVKQR